MQHRRKHREKSENRNELFLSFFPVSRTMASSNGITRNGKSLLHRKPTSLRIVLCKISAYTNFTVVKHTSLLCTNQLPVCLEIMFASNVHKASACGFNDAKTHKWRIYLKIDTQNCRQYFPRPINWISFLSQSFHVGEIPTAGKLDLYSN